MAYRMLRGSQKQEEQVMITGDPTKAKTWKVFARTDVPVGSLLLFPLAPAPSFITCAATHPDRVPTTQTDHDGRALEIAPCVRLPNKYRPETAWISPLWHIQRNKDRSKCNCVMTTLSATSITTIGACGNMTGTAEEVHVSTKEYPVLVSDETGEVLVCTNFVALAAGAELVLFKPEKPNAKAKEKAKAAGRTWMQEKDAVDCARAAKKPKH